MKAVDLEKLKAQIPERDFDRLHASDVWFSIQFKPGYARSLWNFTLALMDAEVEDLATAYKIAEESEDLTHLCGFHRFRFRVCRWEEMRFFFTKLWHNPDILSLKPHLREYIEYICENSRVRWGRGTRPMGLLPMTDGEERERLPWRTSDWHKARYRAMHVLEARACLGCSKTFQPTHGLHSYCDACRASGRRRPGVTPLTTFWPYIAGQPNEEHDLLLAVDSIVPRALSPELRADLCQDLIVSILSGEVAVDALSERLPVYVAQFKKQLPSKYRQLSLDTPLAGQTYSLIDLISTDEYAEAWQTRGRTVYGNALSDCEDADDLAERLRGAWDANRLTEERARTYGEFDAEHKADMRAASPAAVVSSLTRKMRRNVKPYHYRPPSRAGIEKYNDALAWATEDYREKRKQEELNGDETN